MTIQAAVYHLAPGPPLLWPDNDEDIYDRATQLAAITINLEAQDHSTGRGQAVQRVGAKVLGQTQSFCWALGSVP